MPRGRDELIAYCKRVLERAYRVPDDEPWSQIRFPRQDAIKRIKKDIKRISFVVDPHTKDRYITERERILRVLDDNPTLFGVWLIEVLESWQDDMVRKWRAAHEGDNATRIQE